MRAFADYNATHMTPAEKECLIMLYQIRKYLQFKNIDIGQIVKQAVFQSRSKKTNYITDFYLPSIKMAIEVDGGYHDQPGQQIYDAKRDSWIARPKKYSSECKVVRYKNEQILKDCGIRDEIKSAIMARIEEKGLERRLYPVPWQEKAQARSIDSWHFRQQERSHKRGY